MGICLDASQRNTNGGKVHMWSCDTSNQNQQWRYDAGTGQIKNRYGICLDASQRNTDGGKVQMYSCSTSNANQKWVTSAIQTNQPQIDFNLWKKPGGGFTKNVKVGNGFLEFSGQWRAGRYDYSRFLVTHSSGKTAMLWSRDV